MVPSANPRNVFLFQAVVGLASLVSVLTMGRTGLALIAFLAFRPFLFRREPDDPTKRLYARTFRISIVVTALCLGAAWLAREAGMAGGTERFVLPLLAVPAYMVIHGITGCILAGPLRPGNGHPPQPPGGR